MQKKTKTMPGSCKHCCRGKRGRKGAQGQAGPAGLPGLPPPPSGYLEVVSQQFQFADAVNTFKNVTFNTPIEVNGWDVLSLSTFSPQVAGKYLVNYGVKFGSTENAVVGTIMNVNGVVVPGSSLTLTLPDRTANRSGQNVLIRDFIVKLAVGDVVAVQWATATEPFLNTFVDASSLGFPPSQPFSAGLLIHRL
jgi:hypothetical protein